MSSRWSRPGRKTAERGWPVSAERSPAQSSKPQEVVPRPCNLAGDPVASRRTHRTPEIFVGFPVELIQQWCAVSRSTAYQYKCGLRKPSRQALRLFMLHANGRVLGDDWKGWRVERGVIFDPEGMATSRRQLHAYGIMMQFAQSLASEHPTWRERYYDILRMA